MDGKLYLVATPIGNMGDITFRAVETLKECDVIACEDTRHSGMLLKKLGINKPLVSYYMHKERSSGEKIIEMLKEGKNVSLITDAGMPCVSDPGAYLVGRAREEGLEVSIIPGASAVVSAMALSGITARGFCFLGFLPDKKKDCTELLTPYINIDISLVFYVSPHDINKDLDTLYNILGERKVVVVKEITKIFERVETGELSSLRIEEPRGEYVVIIEGKKPENTDCSLTIQEHLKRKLDMGMDRKEAIKLTAKERGIPKDEVYKIAIEL